MQNYKRLNYFLILFIILTVVICGLLACEEKKFAISFEANGGETCQPIVTSGKHGLSLPTPQKDGYSFDGWFFDDGEWEKPLKSDTYSKKKLEEDVTVYAKWNFIGYRVEFDANGGSEVEDTILQKDQAIIKPPFTEREGYKFLGWCVDASCTTFYELGTPINKSATLYAKWISLDNLQHFYVTFESNGGSEVEKIRVLEGESFSMPTTTRIGHDFVGWFIDKELTSIYPQGSIVTSDFTLYAKWEENPNLLTITFDSNGGNDIEPKKVLKNQSFEKPIPYRQGYRFIDWYIDDTNIYDFEKGAYASLTLYAKWEEIDEEKIYFTASYYDGEDLITQIVLEENTKVSNISHEKQGYKFLGWYEDENFSTLFDFGYSISQDINLYGKWELDTSIIEQSMTFDLAKDGDYYILTDFDNSYDEVTIPPTINGLPVKAIGQEVFKDSFITQIQFSEIEEIGISAFENCNLSQATISSNINTLSNRAFANCKHLEKVVFEGNPQMGNYIFSGCNSLTEVTFHKDIVSIPDHMFNNCQKLEEITLPTSCQEIGQGAFKNCRLLHNVQINDNCNIIGSQAFQECLSLSDIDLKNVKEIGNNAFYDSGLISIDLSQVEKLGSFAFGVCKRLEEVHIGAYLEEMDYSFNQSKQIKKYTVDGNNPKFSVFENNLYNKEGTIFLSYAPNQDNWEFSIPEGVESVADFAFSFAKGLEKLTISSTVEVISPLAFLEMQSLNEIIADDNPFLTSQEGVLYDKGKTCLLKYPINKEGATFIMPDSVSSIFPFSFMNAKNLEEITLSKNLEEIPDYAFYEISSLAIINFNQAPVAKIGEEAFNGCLLTEEFSLPSQLTSIGENAFSNTQLKRIIIPTRVAHIGNLAFANNHNLQDVRIGEGIIHLDNPIFQNCSNLEKITFFGSPQSVENAFENCPKINTVIIEGDSVVQITDTAFASKPTLKVQENLIERYIDLHGEKFSEIIGI